MRFSHGVVINKSRDEVRKIVLAETIRSRGYPGEFSGPCPGSQAASRPTSRSIAENVNGVTVRKGAIE